jgi:hypothetical protein
MRSNSKKIRATTVLSVRKNGRAVMAGDGQVTLGDTIMKHKAKKVRYMYEDKVLVGFAGAAADAFNLFERLEGKLETSSKPRLNWPRIGEPTRSFEGWKRCSLPWIESTPSSSPAPGTL